MYNSEFEKQVQQKMEELRMAPSDNLWDRIEKDLPKKPRRNIAILLFLLLIGISGLTWMLTHFYNNQVNKTAAKNTSTKNNVQKTINNKASNIDSSAYNQLNDVTRDAPTNQIKRILGDTTPSLTTDLQQADKAVTSLRQNNPIQKNKAIPTPIKKEDAATVNKQSINNKKTGASSVQKGNTLAIKKTIKNNTRVKIIAAQQDDTGDKSTVKANEMLTAMPYIASAIPNSTVAMHKNLWPGKNIITRQAALTTLAKSDNKTGKRKWEYGITLAGGLSKIGHNPFYFETKDGQVALLGIGGFLPTADSAYDGPTKAKASMSFDVGVYLRRQVKKSWRIQTGFSYSYLSFKRTVGARVDSIGSYSLGGVGINASGYYFLPQQQVQPGSLQPGIGTDYTNKVHLLKIPVEVQYGIGKIKSWYVVGGVSAAYMASSNALVYKSSIPGYLSGREAYNKLLLSLHTGIGYTNTRGWPFSAGFRFDFIANSFFKKGINKQYLQSGLLFINIPLKK